MKYEKPAIEKAGKAQALVLGTKGETPVADSDPQFLIQSVNAYEADE